MIREINLYRVSEKIFLIGIFLLASTMSVGIIFILIATIISFWDRQEHHLNDKWSLSLIMISFLMFISCIVQTFRYSETVIYGWDISLTWIGLLNWIPLFYIFISTKGFLQTSSQRLNVAVYLFSGSIPVLVTGLGQYFFNWEGPLSFSNGLIIWYLKSIEPHLGLSGLFSNQNYAGTWLSLIWPFSLGFIYLNKNNKFKKLLSLLLLIITTSTIVLTTSRNAILGISTAFIFLLGIKGIVIIASFIIFFVTLSSLGQYLPLISTFNELLFSLIPEQFINKFSNLRISNFLEFRRINLWNNTLKLISSKPIFGLGASFFPVLYEIYYNPINYTEQHTHNLFLELAAAYGFLVSISILLFIISLIVFAFKSLQSNNLCFLDEIINKCWIASSLIIILSQMNDVTYYDGRISIIYWILLSGLRNITFSDVKK